MRRIMCDRPRSSMTQAFIHIARYANHNWLRFEPSSQAGFTRRESDFGLVCPWYVSLLITARLLGS